MMISISWSTIGQSEKECGTFYTLYRWRSALNFGGTMVEALYTPFSHSSTICGLFIPCQNLVFAPNMMFVNAVPPFGFSGIYYPGYIGELDRLIAIDANHFMPTHMGRGTHGDLLALRNKTVDFQEVADDEYFNIGPDWQGCALQSNRSMIG